MDIRTDMDRLNARVLLPERPDGFAAGQAPDGQLVRRVAADPEIDGLAGRFAALRVRMQSWHPHRSVRRDLLRAFGWPGRGRRRHAGYGSLQERTAVQARHGNDSNPDHA